MTTVPDATDASDATGPTVGGADSEPFPEPFPEPSQGGSLRLPLSPTGADRVRPVTIGSVVVAAGGLAVATAGGFWPVLVATLVMCLVLAWSWPVLGGSHTPGTTTVVLLIAAPAIVFTSLSDDLRWTAAAVALGVVLSFMGQLIRKTGRQGLVLTLLASFGGLVPMASATLAVASADVPRGRAHLVLTMSAATAALVADLLVRKRQLAPFLGLVALVAAIAGALVAGWFFEEIGGWAAVGVAAGAGSLSWSWRRVLALQPAMLGVRGQVAAGVGSVLIVGVVVHIFTVVS
ncbi:hypothetical protein [Intrasporangium sp.]|uniref:hypothetical protein n=1 Tax=Intrasporangium sp. TaxID=1925024 RepID=UPI0039C8B5E3